MIRFVTAAVFGAAALGAPTVAATAATVGSASFATQRNCSLVTSSQVCDGTGAGQRIAASQYGGVPAWAG